MKKTEVRIGECYTAKVSNKLAKVRIDSAHTDGGWNATNTSTGKRIRIKSAQRLRGATALRGKKTSDSKPVEPDAERGSKAETAAVDDTNAEAKSKAAASKAESKGQTASGGGAESNKTRGAQRPKRVSALDAASQVLAKTGKPMRAKELIVAMAEQGLWTSPAGKTPHATLYAAMLREARDKGIASRFCKVDRGQFALNTQSVA